MEELLAKNEAMRDVDYRSENEATRDSTCTECPNFEERYQNQNQLY